MIIRNLLISSAVAAVALPMAAFGGSMNVKPGAWEVTSTSTMNGMMIPPEALEKMPPERRARIEQAMQGMSGQPKTLVKQSCITKTDLDEDKMFKEAEQRNCTQKIISKSANKMVMEVTCGAPENTKAMMSAEAPTPEMIVSTMDVVQLKTGGKVHVDIKGHWLGDSCAGIEDHN